MLLKILLSGDGGQGIQKAADIICRTAFEAGLFVTNVPNYGLEQRGGVSLSFIQISDQKIVYPKFTRPDIMLILSDQARFRTEQYQDSKAKIYDIKDYAEGLEENKVPTRSRNMFFLGVIGAELVKNKIFESDDLNAVFTREMEKKSGWAENKLAFELGYNR